MESKNTTLQVPPVTSAGMDHGEEILAEVDEPPDQPHWSPTKLHFGYIKAKPSNTQRRESMLTRQLHSETEHTDDEHPGRAMSTQSTWSTQSATSMTELTSDDGRSAPSPAISPPLLPTHNAITLPVHDKPLDQKVKIVGQEDMTAVDKESGSEKAIEANLGRKRCISFACRGKQETKAVSPPTSNPVEAAPASPPKRKCMLTFICPTKSGAENRPAEKTTAKRATSPPPPMLRRSSSKQKHRGSDSTVTHVSPKSVRKASVSITSPPVPFAIEPVPAVSSRRYSNGSDEEDNEATRFHEFGSDTGEVEGWVQESTCHRKRLTISDTLKKELDIRKTCEEAAEEVLEEDGDDDDDLEDDLAGIDEVDDEDAEDDESDDGFHSDDEGGFASSDSDHDDDSDFEWWRPGGASTAATSVEHLDRLAIINSQQIEPGSSVNTDDSNHLSPHTSRLNLRKTSSKTNRSSAIPIIARRGSLDLPDSTDFVCGTLDEDRPLEQAYITRKKAKDAARRPSRPQDIDPSFPTSDPEMDEEDDDDVDEAPESDDEDDDLMHGALDEIDERVARPPTPPIRRSRTNTHRSPPPPARVHTPPPKRMMARSPPPPKRARSPAPRKLFGHSPALRTRSPAPAKRMTSPPNSPIDDVATSPFTTRHGLGTARPQITHTASLPRGGPFALSKTTYWPATHPDDVSDSAATEVPRRGAIDIVKGVEFKRQRRREKLHQKMCAKMAAKGDKTHKVKPGRGAERMREVGLQLQEYRGKAEHILSL